MRPTGGTRSQAGRCRLQLDGPHEQATHWSATRAGETTALGEPKPGPLGRVVVQQTRPVGLVQSMSGLVAAGAGVGLVFALIGRLF